MTGPLLDVKGIRCSYDDGAIVNNISFRVEPGEHACLLGPSGCGKTTILRAIAGFEHLDAGTITLAGSLLSQPGSTLPPERRQLGMVFQDYALFPHLTVADNIGFGLRGKTQARIAEMLELTGLTGLAQRLPQELSGGQQQRVALARALAPSPRILLLDEPFSNLDAGLRQSLSHEVRELLKQAGTSAILVTHDQHEAFAFADTIGLLNHGNLVQWASPRELYQQPATAFVADFIGEGSLIKAVAHGSAVLDTALGPLQPVHSPSEFRQQVLIRPDQLFIDPHSPVRGKVIEVDFRGQSSMIRLQLASGEQVLMIVAFSAPAPSSPEYPTVGNPTGPQEIRRGHYLGIGISARKVLSFPDH